MRPRKIGDLVLLTPTLRAIRRAHPDAHIALLSTQACAEVLANHPDLDEFIEYPARGHPSGYLRLLQQLRALPFDAVLDAYGTPTTARLVWLTRSPRRIGPRLLGRAWAYTHPIAPARPGLYAAAYFGHLLGPLGIPFEDLSTDLHPGAADNEYAASLLEFLGVASEARLVAVSPGAWESPKRWEARNFARVADALVERWNARVLLVYGPGESATAQAVRDAMRQGSRAHRTPTKTLPQLAALLARCCLLVGNDTGTRHIAIAMGVPTVGIFGKGKPAEWSPPAASRHRTVTFNPLCQGDCRDGCCATPEHVLAQAEDLLRESFPDAAPARTSSAR